MIGNAGIDPACLCNAKPTRGKGRLRCPVHTALTLRRPVARKDDLVRMLRPLDNRARIFIEDEFGNLNAAEAELIEDQGPGGPAFLVIKGRRE